MVTHVTGDREYWHCDATHSLELGRGWEGAGVGEVIALASHLGAGSVVAMRDGDMATVLTLVGSQWKSVRRRLVSVSCPVDPVRQQRTAEQAECDQFAKETSRGNWDKVAQP